MNKQLVSKADTDRNGYETSAQSPLHQAWLRFRRHKMAVRGAIIVLLVIAGVILVPLSPYDKTRTNLEQRLQPPSLQHPMGTDDLGRDLLTRLLYGGRISMSVGILAMSLAVVLGTLVGGLAGYYGGKIDTILMRLVEFLMSFPWIFILILLTTLLRNSSVTFLSKGIWPIVLVIGFLSWMRLARIVRGSFLSIKENDFVEVARSIGASDARIMWRHVLPNGLGPIIVAGTLRVATSVVSEAGLSFLGFGVQPPTPSWGNMLKSAQPYIISAPWLAFFPGLMIFITVIGLNFIGDGLRDALDPKGRR